MTYIFPLMPVMGLLLINDRPNIDLLLWKRLIRKGPIKIGPKLVLSSIFSYNFQYFYLKFLAYFHKSSKVQVEILKNLGENEERTNLGPFFSR